MAPSTLSGTDRCEEINAVLDNAIAEHTAWVESDAPYIPEALEEAVDTLIDVVSHGDVPASLRKLVEAVEALSVPWAEWKDEVARTGLAAVMPSNTFWKRLEHVRKLQERATEKPVAPLESIKSLVHQKVPPQQICLIYGWHDARGNPEVWKIEQELDNPGMHSTKCEGWMPPTEKRRREAEARRQASVRQIRQKARDKVEKARRPAPESLAELVQQGVSAEQIAVILKTTVDEVLAACDREGLPRPAEQESVHALRGTHEPEMSEERERSMEAAQQVQPGQATTQKGTDATAKAPKAQVDFSDGETVEFEDLDGLLED